MPHMLASPVQNLWVLLLLLDCWQVVLLAYLCFLFVCFLFWFGFDGGRGGGLFVCFVSSASQPLI